jgi:hypothetical protein
VYRFKSEMWAKVAEEMAVPWRAAEAMHWQLGEADMARRAGVVPFSLSSASMDTAPPGHRPSPSRGHSHNISTSSAGSTSTSHYGRPHTTHARHPSSGMSGSSRSIAARRESTPRSVPPTSPHDNFSLAAISGGMGSNMGMGMGMGVGRGGQMLPSVAEMTTGVSPYATPAYAMSMPHSGGYLSPGPVLPAMGMMGIRPEVKRRATPEMGPRETSRRRQ